METIRLGNEDTCIICETKDNSQEMWAGTCLGGFHFCCHYSYVDYSYSYGPCRDALHKSIELNKAYTGQINASMIFTEKGVVKIINDAREIYRQRAAYKTKKIAERTSLQPHNKLEKITQEECYKDPYKEHREKLGKDPHFQQYLLDEHKCELCGKNGDHYKFQRESTIVSCLNEKQQQFLHVRCHDIIANFAIVKGISLKESFDKLKTLFEKKTQQAGDKKKECRILGSLDLIGNPWNR